jgi:hypothetical protein
MNRLLKHEIPDLQRQLDEQTSFFDNTQDLSRLFCSELTAAIYQRLGLLPQTPSGLDQTCSTLLS